MIKYAQLTGVYVWNEGELSHIIIFNCSMFQDRDPKELKLVIAEEEVKNAEEHASECFSKGLIPILEADGTEVGQGSSTMLIYCDCLKPVPCPFTFSDSCDGSDNKGILVKDNKLFVVKVKDNNNYFATSSLRM